MGDMNGQVAVVTGRTRGIGLAISERLLNRGVKVAVGYATRHDHARAAPKMHSLCRRPPPVPGHGMRLGKRSRKTPTLYEGPASSQL